MILPKKKCLLRLKQVIIANMDNLWLKAQFAAHPEKSKADLARLVGLDAPAISKILSGARQIKAAEYIAMRRFFGLPVDGEPSPGGGGPDYSGAAVLAPLGGGLSDSGSDLGAMDDDAWVMPARMLARRTSASPEQIRIFTVQENVMMPDFMPGEPVLVDLSSRIPSPPGVFIVSDGIGHIIRQCEYVPHSDPPTIRLSASTGKCEPYTMPFEKAGLIGRVIAKLQWL